MIQIKNSEQIAVMKEAGRITAEALLVAGENIRDGIEDYEALNLLENKYNAAKRAGKKIPAALEKECKTLTAVPKVISSDWVTWTRNPEVISSMRERVDTAIEKINNLK